MFYKASIVVAYTLNKYRGASKIKWDIPTNQNEHWILILGKYTKTIIGYIYVITILRVTAHYRKRGRRTNFRRNYDNELISNGCKIKSSGSKFIYMYLIPIHTYVRMYMSIGKPA